MRLKSVSHLVAAVLFLSLAAGAAPAQSVVGAGPNNQATPVKDSSMLKPPPGAKVAVVEWEDLECPACAHAFPFVHAAISQYHIPLIEYDFLIPGHIWSHQAALYARYIKDKISPELAVDYRRDVFAAQYRIATQDDLVNLTKQFFTSHGKQMPFVLDAGGQFERQIEADVDLGKRLGLIHTPTIFVVTPKHWIEVADVSQLDKAIDTARSLVGESSAPVHHSAATTHKHK